MSVYIFMCLGVLGCVCACLGVCQCLCVSRFQFMVVVVLCARFCFLCAIVRGCVRGKNFSVERIVLVRGLLVCAQCAVVAICFSSPLHG